MRTIHQRALRNWFILASLCVACFGAGLPQAEAQTPKLVELTANGTAYDGKIVARTDRDIWLMQRDGRLRRLNIAEISSFQKISDEFQAFNAGELRDLLRREFRNLEVIGTGHYLVVGPPNVVRDYAQTFEDQYRAFRGYFAVRGFDIPEPEFPLVAVVFPDQAAFFRHAQTEGIRPTLGLKGYYIPTTNRISLFHEQPLGSTRLGSPGRSFSPEGASPTLSPSIPATLSDAEPTQWASTDGTLQSTMIHEATHQVAFNTGIHNRLGTANPRWLVEGLATAFEAPGMRGGSLQRTAGARLNQDRLAQFREFVKQRRQPKSLEGFIRNGNLTDGNLLDGYAQSWALTYYLIETRSRDYADYLKLIASRPALAPYTDADRLADFREAFGRDLVLLEAKFLRFLEEAK